MNVIINGEDRSIDGPQNIEQLLGDLGLDGRKVAVERNREIVPKSQYGEVAIAEGDKFEIVHFIGGGAPNGPEKNTVKNSNENLGESVSDLTDEDSFEVAGQKFNSRLLVGTGKYKDFEETAAAIEA